MMKGIYIKKLLQYMDDAEKLNDGNLASCWLGLRITLDAIQEEQEGDEQVKIGVDNRPRCTCYSYPKVQSAGCVIHNPPRMCRCRCSRRGCNLFAR